MLKSNFFEAGIPEERFNYYILFNAVLYFDESSKSTHPSPDELYNEMLTANFVHYIRYFVQQVPQFYPEVHPSPFLRNKEKWLGPFAIPTSVTGDQVDTSTGGRLVPPYETLPFSTGSEGTPVNVPIYYQAYVIPGLERVPTSSAISALVEVTMEFWDYHFHHAYLGRCVAYEGIEMNVETQLFRAGLPEENFNFYLTFKTVLYFAKGSARQPPGPATLISSMVNADFVSYIKHYVRQLSHIYVDLDPNPFERVQEVRMGNLGVTRYPLGCEVKLWHTSRTKYLVRRYHGRKGTRYRSCRAVINRHSIIENFSNIFGYR